MLAITVIIVSIFVAVLIAYIILVYNDIISVRNYVMKNWSNIDVSLKQRSDEIPNLLETVKGYMKHEKELLLSITQARSQLFDANTTTKKSIASDELSSALKSMLMVAENYPKLQANVNMIKLQKRITLLENIISDRRELFNDSVMNYNTKIQQFPDVLLAKVVGFSQYENFTADPDDKNAISVKL